MAIYVVVAFMVNNVRCCVIFKRKISSCFLACEISNFSKLGARTVSSRGEEIL